MSLFDDTDIFSTGNPGQTIFDLPDTELMLAEGFFTKPEADGYYTHLLNETPWREADLTVYDKNYIIPRMIAWYEDQDNKGARHDAPLWTPELLAIRKRVEEECGIKFNSVLLNLYRDGKDGVGWHSDREENFGRDQIIASVTFGETRMFKLRHKLRKDIPVQNIPLKHGSLLLMAGQTQTYWEHQVPKTAKDILPRINLTFRRVNRKIA